MNIDRNTVLSLLDLPFLPEEMRDVLPGGGPVAMTLDA